jgi:hypothetical protein
MMSTCGLRLTPVRPVPGIIALGSAPAKDPSWLGLTMRGADELAGLGHDVDQGRPVERRVRGRGTARRIACGARAPGASNPNAPVEM